MKIIEPKVELVDVVNPDEILKKIERCGRVCYQSRPKGKPEEFIRMLIDRGHESVLEHVSLTFHIVCDRAIMSELTRHRLASFSVESTRYVKYDEVEVIRPPFAGENGWNSIEWEDAVQYAQFKYDNLDNRFGIKLDMSRAVLPLCLKSELYMTANLREWRHILKLRASKHAHPQMRKIAGMILEIIRDKLPVIVEDIQHE